MDAEGIRLLALVARSAGAASIAYQGHHARSRVVGAISALSSNAEVIQ
jgi:hypothetical protein